MSGIGTAYNRRVPPSDYQSGWFAQELGAIERSIDSIDLPNGVVAGTYGDATHVPQLTVDDDGRITAVSDVPITSGTQSLVIGADVPNSTFGSFVTSGLTIPVTSGVVYAIQYTLWGTYTSTGGTIVHVTHPTASVRRITGRRNSSAVNAYADMTLAVTTASPFVDSINVYSGTSWSSYTMTLIPSANGTLDLTFSPANGSQTSTILAGSMMRWWTP